MTSDQIYRKLQRVARERRRATDEILTLYGLESFLARLVQTPFSDDFCLKGGVLLSAHAMRRPTRDIDMQALNFELDAKHMKEVVAAVVAVDADDAMFIDEADMKTEEIRDEDEYSGLRVTLPARIHRAKIVVKLDISTGDPIWPAPQRVQLPGLLGGTVGIQGHPLEMVVAEKTVTMLQRGTTSTRWRDLMDVASLASRFEFQASAIRTASQQVASHRETELGSLRELLEGYGAVGQPKWAAWRRKGKLEELCEANLDDQVERIIGFIDPVFSGLVSDDGVWDPDTYRWS